MICKITEQKGFFEAVLDAVPLPMMVVDKALQVHAYNKAAGPILGKPARKGVPPFMGEVLHCLNSRNTGKNCGDSDCCSECMIRDVVTRTYATRGQVRERVSFKWSRGNEAAFIAFLVTATPFRYGRKTLVILTLEDLGKVLDMKAVLSICGECKKIRGNDDQWYRVEDYLNDHLGVQFSHGLCPRCVSSHYPASGNGRKGVKRGSARKVLDGRSQEA